MYLTCLDMWRTPRCASRVTRPR
jgi:predicted AAA+ superfamily ATPase